MLMLTRGHAVGSNQRLQGPGREFPAGNVAPREGGLLISPEKRPRSFLGFISEEKAKYRALSP